MVLENSSPVAPYGADAHHILASLELQLTALDCLRSNIAAAYLDAAIQQLRVDMTNRSG